MKLDISQNLQELFKIMLPELDTVLKHQFRATYQESELLEEKSDSLNINKGFCHLDFNEN